MALSRVDKVYETINKEHLYVASLLHDIAIEDRNTHSCFAVAGAKRALAVAQRAKQEKDAYCISEAVSMHITPGIGQSAKGSLAAIIADATFLDLAGYRL